MPEMQRYLLCLLVLKEETTLPNINVRATLICKVLNLLQERKEYDALAKTNQKEQINMLLKNKDTLILEVYVCLNQWEQRVSLLAHKQMLFFSANTLPDEAQKLVKENYLQLNGL